MTSVLLCNSLTTLNTIQQQCTHRNNGHDHIDSVCNNDGVLDCMCSHASIIIDAFWIKENLQQNITKNISTRLQMDVLIYPSKYYNNNKRSK